MDSWSVTSALRQIADLTPRHVDDLVAMYSTEWWTSDRTLSEVRLMLDHSSIVVAFEESGTDRLAAFTRVVTDRVYHGTLLDVIVREDLRGRGFGDLLMETVLEHPDLSRLQALHLTCRESKVPFYERWGFERTVPLPALGEQGPGSVMRRTMRGHDESRHHLV